VFLAREAPGGRRDDSGKALSLKTWKLVGSIIKKLISQKDSGIPGSLVSPALWYDVGRKISWRIPVYCAGRILLFIFVSKLALL